MSMNGTTGDPVYGKAEASPVGNEQFTDVYNYSTCGGKVEAVKDGDPMNCPFTRIPMDQAWHGHEIVNITNVAAGEDPVDSDGSVVQSQGEFGAAYVVDTAGVFINVLDSDTQNTEMYLCSNGANHALVFSSSHSGCTWSVS